MGRYYATHQGEAADVAAAIEEHYKPQGPSDRVPSDPVSIAVALADKISTLTGFWAIDEKPTGSKDPYALRRAALGVIKLILEDRIRLSLRKLLRNESLRWKEVWLREEGDMIEGYDFPADIHDENTISKLPFSTGPAKKFFETAVQETNSLLLFFADRLKVQLREQGARHDLVDAVFALEDQDDLVLIVQRVEALGKFLETEDGKNLLAGYKRATNIIRIEEKKDARDYVGKPDPSLYRQDEEWVLARAIDTAKEEASVAVAEEDFEAAMRAMAKLRP